MRNTFQANGKHTKETVKSKQRTFMTVHAVDVCLSACLELDGDPLSNSHKRGQTGALGFKPCFTHQQVTDKN